MFRCPVCREPLAAPAAEEESPRSWRCPTGHVFDVAREGYVNLLVTHQRRRREPGDNAAMLRCRRAFLDAGHYAPLAARLAAEAQPGDSVLDAGCGEGYYTAAWPGRVPGLQLWAVDIAKAAVRMAARRAPAAAASYAVASVYDLPVVDGSIDLLVSVFAPLHSPEFERVLRPGGRAVIVAPGPDHLAGLKRRLFDVAERHPEIAPLQREQASTALRPERTERLRYDLALDTPEGVSNLLGMTPYAWYVAPEIRAGAAAEVPLSTPVDFLVSTYRAP